MRDDTYNAITRALKSGLIALLVTALITSVLVRSGIIEAGILLDWLGW